MAVIQEIHAWSKGIAVWQQDAIARLYENRTLSAIDLEDLYALAKVEVDIPDPKGRLPRLLEDARVAPPCGSPRLVQLTGIKGLSHVNALANGGHLPIALNGLTVIYGENGAGKSGYSRVFKHACRARDQREVILPNANLALNSADVPQAVFETVIDGVATDLQWSYRSPAPEPLSDISIFDTHCARAYIDNHGDFAYAPYGFDILEGLVAACNKLKELATQEKIANAPSDAAYSSLIKEQTLVSVALLEIATKTKPDEIEALATLSKAEQDRLVLLTKTLAEVDPKQKAQALRQKATRFNGLKARIAAAIATVDDEKINQLEILIRKSRSAKSAADLAATEFKQTPGQLIGTGGHEWKALFEAARAFAKVSCPEHEFPELPEEAECPLCQRILGQDGVARLIRFDAFVKQAAERAASDAHEIAKTAYRAVQQAVLDLMFRDDLVEELTEIDPMLAAECALMQQSLDDRKKSAIRAAASEIPWQEVAKLSTAPQNALQKIIDGLHEQAKMLDITVDASARIGMLAERLELSARVRLGEIKGAVLESIAKHEVARKLQRCIDRLDTRVISRKSTELSRTIASQELADALNDELKSLKVHEIHVVMKPESPGGKTKYKLVLQLPGGGTPAAILSEGEQRAIAIASFLAEIKLGKGRGGIVFDDPVSSLDHRRRWEVAERLAIEAKTRQVIVFTHDIYFLCILEQKTDELGTELRKSYIRRTPQGYGVHSQDLPFDLLSTKDRVASLRQMVLRIREARNEGNEDEQRSLTSRCYGRLRLAWERGIEEVLLYGTVQRFGEGVSTKRLKSVVVTDEDYREIDVGMSKSSKFEHDAAMAVGRLPVPDPDELEQDIESLSKWRKLVESRRESIRTTRG